MTDLELFKAIVRATRDVASADVPRAIARVRALLGASPAQDDQSERSARKASSGRNRMFSGGLDRSGDDAA